ncbi:hypothetical protein RND81_14G251600 [Saponaria officinalis]|uniref:Uncharacterized protein n=1 Tax=Saponaria officinalis TaxID=3572 RepID=A0AAW1H1U1_SAPOF
MCPDIVLTDKLKFFELQNHQGKIKKKKKKLQEKKFKIQFPLKFPKQKVELINKKTQKLIKKICLKMKFIIRKLQKSNYFFKSKIIQLKYHRKNEEKSKKKECAQK